MKLHIRPQAQDALDELRAALITEHRRAVRAALIAGIIALLTRELGDQS